MEDSVVMMSAKKIIKEGDHIVMKRDDSYRIMQVRLNRYVFVDKHKFKLDGMVGCPYGSRFEVKNDTIVQVDRHSWKVNIPDCGKGVDNRNIVGKDSNQQLSHEEIMAMKKDGLAGESIVGRLIENSSTFSLKTEYAQDKYIKKKKRKYMLVFVVLRPTTRILIEMYFAKSPAKICHLRIDSLAQILMLGNIRADMNVAVVDTCLGIVVGAVMERLGGRGNVIHVYHGQHPSRPAVDCYDFDQDHMDTLHSFPMEKLNLLKHTGNIIIDDDSKPAAVDENEPKVKALKLETSPDNEESNETAATIVKSEGTDNEMESNPELSPEDTNDNKSEMKNEESDNCEDKSKNNVDSSVTDSKATSLEEKQNETVDSVKPEKKRYRGTFENREAKRESFVKKLVTTQSLMVSKELDCIIIASKFYPTPLVLNLLRYLRPSRQIVVYSQYKESLLECYAQLRELGCLVNFRLTETWLREFQVLPMRTHPLVNMSGTGGYLLVATTILKT
ncbi:tRNA (adenine(58)-N(1))-methyltransferase non-catalytic subunit TRM6-like [Octopus vulgaris]|uniref:tRNA (adenine(58)-N(1))-methyltransferase non-catalytic subunit TRM6 n=1 Tax=Octopus vulgaris TaxID=6645 RepID=A0AA36F901_OCTVU|nr:tRNA (adenine(58)-N(1))-methyltransferase non-catalytic subunit TRM6-like [Octopus vulgaris]